MRITPAELASVYVYPSESKGSVAIDDMRPEHALNAWRLLREDAAERWDVVKRSPLAGALLEQALGENMLFAEDQRMAPLFTEDDPLSEDELLERCYDGLMALAALDEVHAGHHIIAKAKILASYINPKE